jgi:aspartate kinase
VALIVQKFGGSSVGDIDRIKRVAQIIANTRALGHDVVAVVSAMEGETDRLIRLANSASVEPDPREYDALISTGEQVSAALLSMVLISLNHRSRSYTGAQVGIFTDHHHKKARIEEVKVDVLHKDLREGRIPIVTGFQGVSKEGSATTLGRGGSDLTGVALAAALQADECQIYTDVDGVYTTDPRVVKRAKKLLQITFDEMLELSSLGAKVLQKNAVEYAHKCQVPLRVLSTFEEGPGTLITYDEVQALEPIVSGIVFDRNQARFTMMGVPYHLDLNDNICNTLMNENIHIDMLMHSVPSEKNLIDCSFTVPVDDYKQTLLLTQQMAKKFQAKDIVSNDAIAKLSVVGLGMKSHAGISAKILHVLDQEGIKIHLITSSEVKISTIVDERYMELGVRILHTAFGLDA